MTSSHTAKKHSRVLRFLRDAAIVIGMSVALVVVVEVFLRAFFPQKLVGTSIEGQRFTARDEAIGMRYVPGARWHFSHPEYDVEYAINADGFRDARAHPTPKPPGTVRALLLGDSFTFGQGANYDETWAVMAERLLEASGHPPIELVKAGIQGMDQRSEFILMQELTRKYQPDVFVVAFLINDLYGNSLHGIEPEGAEPHASAQDDAQEDAAESWLRTMRRTFVQNNRHGEFHLLNLLRRMLLANDLMYCKLYMSSARGDFMSEPWSAETSRQVQITETLFTRMHDYAQSLGKPLIVLSIPQQFQVLYLKEFPGSEEVDVAVFDRHFSAFAQENGFAWVNSLDSFAHAEEAPAELFYRWDGHLTPAGNRIVADVFVRDVVPLLSPAHEARQTHKATR